MAPRFHRLTLDEFADLLDRFPFSRRVNAVHMHHTWRPNHAQFRGHESIVAMWRHHTQVNGWSDIAQHVTVDPEGFVWTGRSWNRAPASAAGQNGNERFGPFMFEMIGDFDRGRDPFRDPQRRTALAVTALVQKKFGLRPETLRFHREMSSKTCPGDAIDYDEVLAEVRRLHEDGVRAGARAPDREMPFDVSALASHEILHEMLGDQARGADPADAEPEEEGGADDFPEARTARAEEEARGSGLTPEELSALRPHLVNLRQGEFSAGGELTTTPGEVDAIFQEHLPREARAAAARGEPLRVVFWAHGGLVSESSALKRAAVHVAWWRRNGVYPVYFVWETGLLETIGQLLDRTRGRTRAAARDLWDRTTDPLVEAAARTLGGPLIWGGMKRSAERASAERGGARYAAVRLAEFLRAEAGRPDGARAAVEVHAVGHSAGSIFHAHFLPAALDAGVPAVRSLHLLAPAIRTDLFREALAPRLGDGVDHLTMFTMRRDLERADHCKRVYRKSLLYLIHHALEPRKRTPILGLEESVRDDAELRALFGLGAPSPVAEVVWSKSPTASGRSASGANTHGGFDDDPATMNSIARRVLGKNDTEPLASSFPAQRARGPADEWDEEPDWPEGLAGLGSERPADAWTADAGRGPAWPGGNGGSGGGGAGGGGRRRALCVGIDRYASSPLSGCVADARLWARTLQEIGFAPPTVLTDRQATRGAILGELEGLLAESRPGDVVVFQFAGHGTQLPDAGGDEAGGDTPDTDEALCPFDMDTGAFVIDDDLAEVLARTPPGVNVTLFIDCCHSGTVSRFGVGTAAAEGGGRDERPRFIVADPELKQAHLDFRARLGRSRARHRGPETMTEVLFSACLSSELAWESNGQGEFTLRATGELRRGVDGVSHEAFAERVRRAFGPRPRQHPELDCAPEARSRALLQPLAASGAASPGGSSGGDGRNGTRVASLLRELAAELE